MVLTLYDNCCKHTKMFPKKQKQKPRKQSNHNNKVTGSKGKDQPRQLKFLNSRAVISAVAIPVVLEIVIVLNPFDEKPCSTSGMSVLEKQL